MTKKIFTLLSILFLVTGCTGTSAAGTSTSTSTPSDQVHLSDLEPVVATVGRGSLGRGVYPFDNKPTLIAGKPIVSAGIIYLHGLFTNAPSRIVYNLGGAFQSLETGYLLHNAATCSDGVTFHILLDNVEVFTSPVMLNNSQPGNTRVDLNDARLMTLVVDSGLSSTCDWGIWGDPLLTLLPGASVPPLPSATSTPMPTETLTPYPAPTNTATLTPFPPQNISFFHLRFEYSTTSDWSRLTLSSDATILTYAKGEVTGNPEGALANVNPDGSLTLLIYRPVASLQENSQASMSIDLGIPADSPQKVLSFALNKGALNISTLRVYLMNGEEKVLLKERIQVVESAEFRVSLDALKAYQPLQQQVTQPNTDRMVWAIYYPWYLGDQTGYCGWADPMYTDRPLDHYRSDDPTAIAHQVELAQSAGIDGFLVSYDDPNFIQKGGLRALLQVGAETGFKVGIFLETINPDAVPPVQSKETLSNWVYNVYSTFAFEPAWFRINGKPLIVVDIQHSVPLSFWAALISDLTTRGVKATYWADIYDPTYLQVFDGITQYGVPPENNLADLSPYLDRFVRNASLLTDDPGSGKMWAAAVMPGFDNTPLVRHFEGWKYSFTDREGGNFYRQAFEAAIQSNADWIIIATWNEYQENTEIEPSELFGDFYLDLTREYVRIWKSK